MTNYVMLELLLTRFEDRRLFPPQHAGVLRFLVLDEVHTYTGKQGADVPASSGGSSSIPIPPAGCGASAPAPPSAATIPTQGPG